MNTYTIGKIVIVEDHKMVREMLAQLLSTQSDVESVGQAGSVGEARAVINELRPELVLLDVSLPDGSGIELARDIKESTPEVKVIVLTGHDKESMAMAAISTGCEGYLVKDNSLERLMHAIRSVAAGDHVYDSSVVSSIVRRFTDMHSSGDALLASESIHALSDKEKRIAVLVAQGMTNKEIATLTFTTINTVKTHLRRMFTRLQVSSRRELVQLIKTQSVVSGENLID